MTAIKIPDTVSEILDRFISAGFGAYAVGGCVRDSLLGRKPNDWDIAVSCAPDTTVSLFDGMTIPTGIKHGTVTILYGGMSVEATTFRTDGSYSDHRRPDSVAFADRIEDDLARRDFTVNAMAASADGCIIDPYGGQRDLTAGLIRAVGEPAKRFSEDALRIFRAFRFSSQLGFDIEANTLEGIRSCAGLTVFTSAERIHAELDKLLIHNCSSQLKQIFSLGLLKRFCLSDVCPDFSRLDSLPPVLIQRLSALCAVLESAGAIKTEDFLTSLRYDKHSKKCCVSGVYIARTQDLEACSKWKHLISERGKEAALCAASAAYALGNDNAHTLYSTAIASGGCLRLSDLAVKGTDLIDLGLRGKAVGLMLNFLLSHVIDVPEDNRPEVLLQIVSERILSEQYNMQENID